ncbi:MAG: hypothetical protein JXA94_03550 [Parachlamydiales bacterium]|nr:hypothetical protein [Parachlamydiales bacterium]
MSVSPTVSDNYFLPIPPDEDEEELEILLYPHEGAISSISFSDMSSRGSTGLAKLFESLDLDEKENPSQESPEVPARKARRVFHKTLLEDVESEEEEEEEYRGVFRQDQEAHHLQQTQRRPYQDIEEYDDAESKKPRKDPPCALKYHSRVHPEKYKERLFQARQRKKDNQLYY